MSEIELGRGQIDELMDVFRVPWEEGRQGVVLDWASGWRVVFSLSGSVDKERPTIRVNRLDGLRILRTVEQAPAWTYVGHYYIDGGRQVIELPTIIIEWE